MQSPLLTMQESIRLALQALNSIEDPHVARVATMLDAVGGGEVVFSEQSSCVGGDDVIMAQFQGSCPPAPPIQTGKPATIVQSTHGAPSSQ